MAILDNITVFRGTPRELAGLNDDCLAVRQFTLSACLRLGYQFIDGGLVILGHVTA
jgi:hypothetical protein